MASIQQGSNFGAAAAAAGLEKPSTSECLPPLTSVLFADSIGLPNAKSSVQVELRRAINAATGGKGRRIPAFGNIQSKALEHCSAEEIKRVKNGLMEGVHRPMSVSPGGRDQ